jgi:3-deoxy-manno-octulosonate cytidylyltransferase (CMP-KDO synthetase)
MSSTTFHAIIPARYQSTRFPGKPLADIRGKPMFWHVYNRARQCRALSDVVLATDDDRIREAADRLQVPVMMTGSDHLSGSDRVLEAAQKLNIGDDAVVVNVQGDEPLLEPQMLTQLIEPFRSADVRVTTLARAFDAQEDRGPDRVKVVFSNTGRALYFSRSPIPFPRDAKTAAAHLHIGLYAFRMDILKRYVSLPQGRLEKLEKLEQLRLLENDIPMHVVVTEHRSIGVDRPEDLAVIEKLLGS